MSEFDYTAAFYGSSYIGGTAAPEFTDYPHRVPREENREVVIPAAPEVRERTKAVPRVRSSQEIAPSTLVGLICAAVLVVFSLMARIQFTAVSDQTVALETKLESLQVEQTRLRINYESAFNMTEIEEYATSTLGMQRPRDEQTVYLNSSVPDKAVIIEDKNNTGKNLFNRISDMLSSIGEYF